jgi:hypothetical protein
MTCTDVAEKDPFNAATLSKSMALDSVTVEST